MPYAHPESYPLRTSQLRIRFSSPTLLPRRAAGRIYVHAASFPKGQMFLYSHADRIQAISSAVCELDHLPSAAII